MGIWNLIDELLWQESALFLFYTVQHFFYTSTDAFYYVNKAFGLCCSICCDFHRGWMNEISVCRVPKHPWQNASQHLTPIKPNKLNFLSTSL